MKFSSIKWSHYKDAYQEEFSRVSKPVAKILEIGVAGGGSLEMWKEMYPDAQVVGLDIDPRCKGMEKYGCAVEIGDQTDRGFLRKVVERHAPFSIIVDDGGHWPFMQRIAFQELWPGLAFGGCYCIEDLHTAYSLRWGGRSFLRYCYGLVDAMNGHHFNSRSPYRGQIGAVNFRDSLVFIHKAQWKKPHVLDTSGLEDIRGPQAHPTRVKSLMFSNLVARVWRGKRGAPPRPSQPNR